MHSTLCFFVIKPYWPFLDDGSCAFVVDKLDPDVTSKHNTRREKKHVDLQRKQYSFKLQHPSSSLCQEGVLTLVSDVLP